MAERPEPRRYAGPIVPDPEASLTTHRPRYPQPPRVWPLWLLVLMLGGALGAMGWFGWQERQRLEAESARLSGELSNVHARFDAAIGEGDGLERLETRLEALERQDATQQRRFGVVEEDLAAGLERLKGLIDRQATRLTRMGEAAATREAMLVAFQDSLDALERAGEEGRGALEGRLDLLSEAREQHDRRLTELQERAIDDDALDAVRENQAAVEERLADGQAEQRSRLEELQARVAALAETLEGVDEAREDDRQQWDALRQRLTALEAEAGELRRSQLALSARLEALRP
ncbi:hypothetical protein RAN53_12630 [Halomonas sp. SSL-5]|uniref:hypothetical protein n=1 Tax=Halomonas sp. SSL-5 TaxID=3065855 RepID=UPI0027394A02|nr:hypothetical protein [Halomonas sp. SSL-5]MDY7117192.1 hypothetical protein [Halomonas sp. SSL-5]